MADNPQADAATQQTEPSLRVLLTEMIQKGASDLHLTVGQRAKVRIDGDLTDVDRSLIVQAVQQAVRQADAVLILHGTDTLEVTGEALHRALADLTVTVVLTGAMRPYEFRNTDAAQNVTEALLACRQMPPGVYVAMHNRVLRFPGVVKDRPGLSFIKNAE